MFCNLNTVPFFENSNYTLHETTSHVEYKYNKSECMSICQYLYKDNWPAFLSVTTDVVKISAQQPVIRWSTNSPKPLFDFNSYWMVSSFLMWILGTEKILNAAILLYFTTLLKLFLLCSSMQYQNILFGGRQAFFR